MHLDAKNKNSKWRDAKIIELEQINDYKSFKDLGYKAPIPKGYKKIRVHMVYNVKHNGRHKARLVAGGHLTNIPIESIYSGVVSLCGLCIVLFLAELNGLETYSTDIGNAYLEAETKEKVCITTGPEFGDKENHTLIIFKALYGLQISGKRWHEKFADTLGNLGFFPCKAEPEIWMRRNGNLYEYIAVYVDDLAIATKDPQAICKILTDNYNYKLKGTGSISFHLDCDFYRDQDNVLCMALKKYIDKLVNIYKQHFGERPRQHYSSPLDKGDHPEIDKSDLLGYEGIKIYQSLIGALQ